MVMILEKETVRETQASPLAVLPEVQGEVITQPYAPDMPDDVQSAVDKLIQHYKDNGLKPQASLKGSPLDITVALARLVKGSVPQELMIEAKTLLDFMIREIVAYCRETQSKSLSLHFSFERGGAGR